MSGCGCGKPLKITDKRKVEPVKSTTDNKAKLRKQLYGK